MMCWWQKKLPELTGYPFVTAPNKFESLAAHDAMVEIERRPENAVPYSLMHIANNMRMLSFRPALRYRRDHHSRQ